MSALSRETKTEEGQIGNPTVVILSIFLWNTQVSNTQNILAVGIVILVSKFLHDSMG